MSQENLSCVYLAGRGFKLCRDCLSLWEIFQTLDFVCFCSRCFGLFLTKLLFPSISFETFWVSDYELSDFGLCLLLRLLEAAVHMHALPPSSQLLFCCLTLVYLLPSFQTSFLTLHKPGCKCSATIGLLLSPHFPCASHSFSLLTTFWSGSLHRVCFPAQHLCKPCPQMPTFCLPVAWVFFSLCWSQETKDNPFFFRSCICSCHPLNCSKKEFYMVLL